MLVAQPSEDPLGMWRCFTARTGQPSGSRRSPVTAVPALASRPASFACNLIAASIDTCLPLSRSSTRTPAPPRYGCAASHQHKAPNAGVAFHGEHPSRSAKGAAYQRPDYTPSCSAQRQRSHALLCHRRTRAITRAQHSKAASGRGGSLGRRTRPGSRPRMLPPGGSSSTGRYFV